MHAKNSLPFYVQYLWDDLPNYHQFLLDHPPKYTKHQWKSGTKTIALTYSDHQNYNEFKNDCINNHVPIDEGAFSSVLLEITHKSTAKKSAKVSARIDFPQLQLYMELIKGKTQPAMDGYEMFSKRMLSMFGSPENFLSRYESASFSENGTITFTKRPSLQEELNEDGEVKQFYTGGSVAIHIYYLFSEHEPYPYTPGEIEKLQEWCYDLKANCTTEQTLPGAYVSLTYQHLLSSGEKNPTPWCFTVKNYDLVRKGHTFIHKNEVSLSFSMSTDMLKEIWGFLDCEEKRHMHHIYERAYIQSILSQENED
jgi:hypothetical protein